MIKTMFTDRQKYLIKVTILEKMQIFKKGSKMWWEDQKEYKRILKKIDPKDEIKINKDHLCKVSL